MSIHSISSAVAPVFDRSDESLDAALSGHANLDAGSATSALTQLGSANFAPQTLRPDPLTTQSDACVGACELVGMGLGAAVGFGVGNGPGAVAGFGIGWGLGSALGQIVCDPNVWPDPGSDPRDTGGAPDAGTPPADPEPTGDTPGGISFPEGGGESNAGNLDTSGNMSVSPPPPPSDDSSASGTSGSSGSSSGTSGTDDTSGSGSDSSSSDNGRVGGTNGGSDMPADDGGYYPINPRVANFSDVAMTAEAALLSSLFNAGVEFSGSPASHVNLGMALRG